MAVAPNGNMYVVNVNNHRIQYFTSTGSYLGRWGSYGAGNGQFNAPTEVAVAPDGAYVYVADCWNHRIRYFYAAAFDLYRAAALLYTSPIRRRI